LCIFHVSNIPSQHFEFLDFIIHYPCGLPDSLLENTLLAIFAEDPLSGFVQQFSKTVPRWEIIFDAPFVYTTEWHGFLLGLPFNK